MFIFKKLIVLIQVIFFSIFLSGEARAYVEIVAEVNGSSYIIPFSIDDKSRMIEVAEFYAKDKATGIVNTTLSSLEKSKLLAMSNAFYFMQYESNYFDNYNKFYDFVEHMRGVAIDAKTIVSVGRVLGSLVNIASTTAAGCAAGYKIGAVVATATVVGTPAAPVVGWAGCKIVSFSAYTASTLDEAASYVVSEMAFFNPSSVPNAILKEGDAAIYLVDKYNSVLQSKLNSVETWNRVINEEVLNDVWNTMIDEYVTITYFDRFIKEVKPVEYSNYVLNTGYSFAATSIFVNVLSQAVNGVRRAYPIPVSTIGAIFSGYSDNITNGNPASVRDKLVASLPELNREWASWKQSVSPLSPKNLAEMLAAFEAREPITSSTFQLPNAAYDVNDALVFDIVLSQPSNGIYSSAATTYSLVDRNGNLVSGGNMLFSSVEGKYKANIKAPSKPGEYMVAIDVKDSNGNDIYKAGDSFIVNNPAEGHDLAVNTFSISRTTAEQGKHAVDINIGVKNNGIYTENAVASLVVTGPANYQWQSPSINLGAISPNEIKTFNNLSGWSVPASVINGSYSISINAVGDSGDFTIIDNTRERSVYVGKIDYPTPVAMLAKEVTVPYNNNLELSGYLGGGAGAGGYGWINYSNNGNSYKMAFSGYTSGQPGGKGGIVVTNANGSLVYASSGPSRERVGEPVYIPGTNLILFFWGSSNSDGGLVIAENYQGIGFGTRNGTSIPNLERDYQTTSNLSCSTSLTRVHEARVTGNGWKFNIAWQLNSQIQATQKTCTQSGRTIGVKASTPGAYYFIAEYPGSNPSGYNPSISGYSSIQNYTIHFYSGELTVEDYNDIALSSLTTPSSIASGDIANIVYNIVNQGTVNPTNITALITVTDGLDYKYEETVLAHLGSNSYSWDLNGQLPGNYSISVKVLSEGDADLSDIALTRAVTVLSAPTTFVTDATPIASAESLVRNGVKVALPTITMREGDNREFVYVLMDNNGQCSSDGYSYLMPLDIDNVPLSFYKAILEKDVNSCVFRANIQASINIAKLKIIGHLNRYVDGNNEQAISVIPNNLPVVAITHSYAQLQFDGLQSVVLEGLASDPDSDQIDGLKWYITDPLGNTDIISSGSTLNYLPNTFGDYKIFVQATDSLGKSGFSETIILTFYSNIDTDGDGIIDFNDPDDDNDGLPDTWEIANGLDSLDAADAALDVDTDGLTNLQEYQSGTDPNISDTDGDGVIDGQDVFPTDPLEWADTDADGIGDNSDPGSFALSTTSYSVDESSPVVSVVVNRVAGAFGAVTFDITTTDGTAVSGQDYTGIAQTINMIDGQISVSLDVAIIDNSVYEGNKDFTVTLSNATAGADITFGTASVTIIENDPLPPSGDLTLSATTYAIAENGTSLLVTVNRENGSFGDVSVDYATSDASATASNDYTTAAGTLTFLDGELSKTFSIDIIDDVFYEGDETFNLTLSNIVGGNAGTIQNSVITITEDDPVPPAGVLTLSSASYSVIENAATLSITVDRVNGNYGLVSVDYSTTDGTAVAGADYSSSMGTLTFLDGEITKTFNVSILDDIIYEGDEVFNLLLSNVVGTNLGDINQTTITINENDPVPPSGEISLSSANYTIAENAGVLTIDLNRTNGTYGDVSVNWQTLDVTAIAGQDYTAGNGAVSFVDGEVNKQVSITILDDTNYEGDETFSIDISNPFGGVSLGAITRADITVSENDPVPPAGSLQWSGSGYSANENAGAAVLTINRVNGSYGDISVDVSSIDETATSSVDYTSVATTVSYLDGETSKTVIVDILDDAEYEGDETFSVSLSNPTGNASIIDPITTQITIVEDDPVPPSGNFQFSGNSYSVNENSASIDIIVNRINGSFGDVSVDVSTIAGSATDDIDYVSFIQTLIFLDGETTKMFSVNIIDDTVYEGDESLTLQLSNPIGDSVVVEPSSAVLTIIENEPVPPSGDFQLSAASFMVDENSGSIDIVVNRVNGSYGTLSVDVKTLAGTATSGVDFTSLVQTINFIDGEVSRIFTINLIDDSDFEGNETFTVQLSNSTGTSVIVEPATAIVTIVENDPVPPSGELNWSEPTKSLKESVGQFDVTVNRTNGSFGGCQITAILGYGTAISTDFTETSDKDIVFLEGELSNKASFTINDDLLNEPDEAFTIELSNIVNCTLGNDSSMAVTITKSDVPAPPPPPAASSGGGSLTRLNLFFLVVFFGVVIYRRRGVV